MRKEIHKYLTNLSDWGWKGSPPHSYPEIPECVSKIHFSCYIIKDTHDRNPNSLLILNFCAANALEQELLKKAMFLYCLSHANQSALISKNSVNNGFQIDLAASVQMHNTCTDA